MRKTRKLEGSRAAFNAAIEGSAPECYKELRRLQRLAREAGDGMTTEEDCQKLFGVTKEQFGTLMESCRPSGGCGEDDADEQPVRIAVFALSL